MFKNRLKELRERNGYSMDKLAEIYNNKFNGKMNKSTLSRYENGLQEPMYTVVVNLSELFNVSVDYMTCSSAQEESKPDSVELENDVIIYNRNGKIVKRKMSKEKMDMLASMIDAIPEDNNPDL